MASTGAKVCGTVESVSSWVNCTTTRLNTSDNSRATHLGFTYKEFQLSDFSFGIPAGSTIDGIEVYVEFRDTWGFGSTSYIRPALSYNDGTNWTAFKPAQTNNTSTDVVRTFGGSTDTWGRTWTVAEFAVGTFRLKISGYASFYEVGVDKVSMAVYYTEGLTTSTSTTSTSISTSTTSTSTTSTSTSTTSSSSSTSTTSSSSSSSSSISTSTTSSSTSTTSSSLSTSTTSSSSSSSSSTSTTSSSSSTSTTSSSTSTTSSSSSTSTTTTIGPLGTAWGEQSPTAGENPVSWQVWSDGAGGSPTITGDADWGKIQLGTGILGHSDVIDTGNLNTKTITVINNKYGSS